MNDSCVFCAIIAGSSPATVVHRWPDAIAIVPLSPVVEGHLLVIPTTHVRDALEDPDVTASTMRRAAEIAPHPCNLITNVGREATQSVFHLHLHVVPRAENDGLALPWYSGRRGTRSSGRDAR
jgi:histidine triad (HIT) family protein